MCVPHLAKWEVFPAFTRVPQWKLEEKRSCMKSSYSCYARPDASHGHPYLVFDCQGELHLPLIAFAKEALTRLAPSSVQKYLTNILPWFTWPDTDPWQLRARHCWTDPPEVLRDVLREYLVSKLQCRVKPHQEGGEWLETTEEA